MDDNKNFHLKNSKKTVVNIKEEWFDKYLVNFTGFELNGEKTNFFKEH